MKRQAEQPRNNYCFTYNNYTQLGEAALVAWLVAFTKYAVFGHEVAPTTGTPHLQGFFSLIKKSRTQTIQKQLGEVGVKLSLIHSKGTPEQNRVYCTKADPNGFYEHGQVKSSGQGARTDLVAVAEKLPNHIIEQIAEAHPVEYIKYHRGIERLHGLLERRRIPENRDITVTVYYGTGGTGKTLKAHQDARRLGIELYIVTPPTGTSQLWYDHYIGQRGILLDDFYGWITPHVLFRILDRYRLLCPVKGDHRYAQWNYVWITSNVHPDNYYSQQVMKKINRDAYERRFHNIYLLTYYNEEKTAVEYPYIEKEEQKIQYLFPSKPRVTEDRTRAITDEDASLVVRPLVPDQIMSPPSIDEDNIMFNVD